MIARAGAVPRPAVRIVLYAAAREAVGRPELFREVPRRGIAVRDLRTALVREFPTLARVLPTCRVARNGTYVRGPATRLRPGDEVAIHPPFSGG